MTDAERLTYKTALNVARTSFDKCMERLDKLTREREALDLEVANLRKTITALSAMCSDEPGLDKLGITDSVMQVMSDTSYSFTTGEVVGSLEMMGFDLQSQKNVQASVHAVLTRLAKRGKLTRVANAKKNDEGHPWEWRGPAYDATEDVKAGYCYRPGEKVADEIPF